MSTALLYGTIRGRVLPAVPSGLVFTLEPPENAAPPYAVLRLQGRRTGGGDDGRYRERGDLEVMVFGRPRASLPACEGIMDGIEARLLHWVDTAHGVFVVRGLVSRETLPPYQSPENREVVQIRALFGYTWWGDFRAPSP